MHACPPVPSLPQSWHTVVQQLMNEDGEHMLLILDGFDKLTAKQRKDDFLLFSKI